ncbi:MAG: plasmid stabilization protein [Piscirickettsiaceae bacterium CG_4_9_14_3_um_filter_43_564]|nr:ImmA/IrrE family metallo-endopeptidase [Thiomicrospira sp.]OIP94075.1 MAG: plasmid stabilization protein [Thiomicrospira sp. CG2_30_44_34]PIQ05111.1 MAG: plasmid stabilization protein [Piscirickettsiaceae bacterium CG18_big_fil_WC_8_21_14_2_50_44_103]PIU38125.1 MAG: plasmid stabilization protein [Piscirickettsiaceae bacterium CG07_land_8_20_14_0_80_44_28]PIW76972.1 MAG: plasmid stabilization protein [Piscirickettsiaceae bacterium CG_4_8_14_3_um_filter_44_38]PIX78113.1 MAG: plasmid stabiliza
MNNVKVIKNEQEHAQAMERLMALIDQDPAEGTKAADELELLTLVIEKYEDEQFSFEPPTPIEAIKFRMEQMGLKNKDLTPYIGSASKVSEVLNGKRSLSLPMIRKLHEGLGISLETLIQDSSLKKIEQSDIEWQSFPLAEMRKRGYFGDFSGSVHELKEYAAEKVSQFLSSVPQGFNLKPALMRTTAHDASNDKEVDLYALWAWQVRVLQLAKRESLPTNYHPNTVNLEWMKQVAQLSWSQQGPLLAKEFLNTHGIHLIFEEHLPKTYLDGAVCIAETGNPVVALSLRHDRLDNFWFTLMHELAHIALHLDNGEGWFIDDMDAKDRPEVEKEADELAQSALLPKKSTQGILNAQDVNTLAKELKIAPDIIAGRIRYERNNYQLFGQQFKTNVKCLLNV